MCIYYNTNIYFFNVNILTNINKETIIFNYIYNNIHSSIIDDRIFNGIITRRGGWMNIKKFQKMLEEILETIPKDFFKELNGGVILLEEAEIHPEALSNDLFILGTYTNRTGLGRYITIYYESFIKIYGHLSEEELKVKLKETVYHEFTHHLESLAGFRDLKEKDREFLRNYLGE